MRNTPRQKPSGEAGGGGHSDDDFSCYGDFNRWRWSGRERCKKIWAFFIFFYFVFVNNVFVVKVQETVWSAGYGVNKTVIPTTTRFTPSWEKSNSSEPEHTLPPNSTLDESKTEQYLPPDT